MSATLTYGGFNFSTVGPNPLLTVNKEVVKSPSNSGLYSKHVITLNGTILDLENDGLTDPDGGLSKIFTLIKTLKET